MISTESKYTITIGIAFFAQRQLSAGNMGRQLTAALLATIPILIIFLSVQKMFIKGITMGGIKG